VYALLLYTLSIAINNLRHTGCTLTPTF
jgi:hypothetical protein